MISNKKAIEYKFFDFRVEIDETATRAWYAGAEEWGCDCGDCINFVAAARERVFPAPILELLDGLGIPPEKATYVCSTHPEGDGLHYCFSYRIAGRILEGNEHILTSLDWGECGCTHDPYPYGAPGFPEPHFDLEFWAVLPWVVDDSLRGEPIVEGESRP